MMPSAGRQINGNNPTDKTSDGRHSSKDRRPEAKAIVAGFAKQLSKVNDQDMSRPFFGGKQAAIAATEASNGEKRKMPANGSDFVGGGPIVVRRKKRVSATRRTQKTITQRLDLTPLFTPFPFLFEVHSSFRIVNCRRSARKGRRRGEGGSSCVGGRRR